MRGPSSSHGAAALRIGRIAKDLMGGNIKKALVEYDPNGYGTSLYVMKRCRLQKCFKMLYCCSQRSDWSTHFSVWQWWWCKRVVGMTGTHCICSWFSSNRSLVTTHSGQGSDMGLYSGFMGWDAVDERLKDFRDHLNAAGIEVNVEYVRCGRITLCGRQDYA